MKRSTVLYTCNNTGMHDVSHAIKYGTVVYDWSNAKQLWANAHPMNSQELIVKQAEMVLAADPGVEGYNPRVWAYRNTIKALNWYGSVREKLCVPLTLPCLLFRVLESSSQSACCCCAVAGMTRSTARGSRSSRASTTRPTPGARASPSTAPFTYPRVTGTATPSPARPSAPVFTTTRSRHPKRRSPAAAATPRVSQHASSLCASQASMKLRTDRVDGECVEQCDCGKTNPCAEYIFDNRGGEVEGRNFTEWFINEYMVTNETLLHKNPKTGKPQVIGLGWLDE